MSAETAVMAGAVICVAPVIFGLIVAAWDRAWSREREARSRGR